MKITKEEIRIRYREIFTKIIYQEVYEKSREPDKDEGEWLSCILAADRIIKTISENKI